MKLYNGDCLEIMKQIPDNSIDLILTDPPYLMNYKTGYRKDKTHKFCSEIANDDNFDLISNYIKECFRILKNNSAILMFCNCTHIDFFKQELEKYFNVKNIIVWVKNNWSAGDLKHSFGRQYEFLVYASKGQKKINGFRYSDVWEFDRVDSDKLVHQNQKPISLLERVIKSFTFEGGVVFDGFMGSGSTGIACKNLNRDFIGVELDKEYFRIAKERIENGFVQKEVKTDFGLFE